MTMIHMFLTECFLKYRNSFGQGLEKINIITKMDNWMYSTCVDFESLYAAQVQDGSGRTSLSFLPSRNYRNEKWNQQGKLTKPNPKSSPIDITSLYALIVSCILQFVVCFELFTLIHSIGSLVHSSFVSKRLAGTVHHIHSVESVESVNTSVNSCCVHCSLFIVYCHFIALCYSWVLGLKGFPKLK